MWRVKKHEIPRGLAKNLADLPGEQDTRRV
jgi:hypothetical protein